MSEMIQKPEARSSQQFLLRTANRELRTPGFLSLMLLSLSVLWLFADTACADREATTPIFEVRTLAGQRFRGQLQALKSGWTVTLRGDGPRTVPGAQILWLRRVPGHLPGPPRGRYVLFANGDRLPADLIRADEEQVRFRPTRLQPAREWNVPLTAVRGYWLRPPLVAESAERFQWEWERATPSQDRITLQNGDVLEGLWRGARNDTFLLLSKRRLETMSRDLVAAIGFNTSLLRWREPQPPYACVLLADGTRLSLTEARLLPTGLLAGTTVHGTAIEVPLANLLSLEPHVGKVVYLSDLEPHRYVHVPYLDTSWPYVRDGSVAHQWLQLAGQVFEKGLGLHSQSELTYALADPYDAFEAIVGLDERTGRHGSVRIQVLVDGQERYASPELTGGQAPVEIRVGLDSARWLTLRVQFGRGGDVTDHVNWAEARLLKP